MSAGALAVLAIGLAMDATAVSVARGVGLPVIRPRHVVSVTCFFGGAQALMPLLGWILGEQLGELLAAWDHWIAFGLLVAIGAKMLWEALTEEAAQTERPDRFGFGVMAVLALATSIDALAVGITLPLLGASFVLAIVTIGATTAVLSAAGLYAGRRFGVILGRRLEALGGLILIGLGVKILLEHLA